MKRTKTKLVSSIVTLLVCFAMLVGSTFAWFTDSASTGVNTIQAGNLDVEFYKGEVNPVNKISTDTKLFQVDKWEPGVVSVEKLIVRNEGNLALKFKMGISNLVGDIDYNYVIEEGQTNPTDKSLLDVLYVYTSPSNIDVTTARSLSGSNGILLKDFISNNNFLSGELGYNGASKEINVAIYWPQSSIDNEYNINNGRTVSSLRSGTQTSLVVNFPVTLAATQLTSESDSFDNQYDATATYPFVLPESTTTIVDTPTTDFYSDYQGTSVITPNENDQLQEKVTVTATSATSINLDVEYTYGDTTVHKFTEVREKTYPLSKNLSDVTVTHSDSSVTMTGYSSKEAYNDADDTAYYYDSQSGVLYVKSSKYSKFTVTYKHNFVAVIDGEGYSDLSDAIYSIKSSDETVINLVNNIDTPNTSYYFKDKNVVLNLNGYTISGSGYDGTLCVNSNATLTINGEGNLIGNVDREYGMAIWASGTNSNVIINGGSYSNTFTPTGDDQMDLIYASNGGKIVINDGEFNCITPKWTLNVKDVDYKNGTSSIKVYGGTFYNYDPSNSASENPIANFVAVGYEAKENDGKYVVSEKIYDFSCGAKTELNTEVPDDIDLIDTQEELNTKLTETVNDDVNMLYLAEGNFNIKDNINCNGKTIVFIGAGYDKTTLKYGKTPGNQGAEGGSCYSFENANVTFKDVTLQDVNGDNVNYKGFVRSKELKFENCLLKSLLTYLGENGGVTFKNCTFETPEYAAWIYSSQTYNFENCLFKSPTGKFLNVYSEANITPTINATQCRFVDTSDGEKSKAVFNIKKQAITKLTIEDCVVTGASPMYKVAEDNGTVVTIDGKIVYPIIENQ